MKKKLFSIFILFGIFSLTPACVEDAVVDKKLIIGDWEVYEAQRNRRATSTFKDAYFKITETNFETNITGEVVSTPYSLSKQDILPTNEESFQYKVISSSQDSLTISTSIQKYDFIFKATRASEK